jgi:DNA (cytosine-5)-methyltransferase 1
MDRKIRFIDLFAGIGGLHLGLVGAAKLLGLDTEVVLAAEIDKDARSVYQTNFGHRSQGDVRAIEDLAPHDVLLAGFPCQSFSYAGKKAGFGDTRGTLFFEIMRLIEDFKPPVMIFENVAGLVAHDQGRTFKTIQHEVEEQGYSFDWFYLNSSNFGLPQNRLRVYMVCMLGGRKTHINLVSDKGPKDSHAFNSERVSLFGDTPSYAVVRDILEDNPDSKYDCSPEFVQSLKQVLNGRSLDGIRLIDYRGGNSVHSWELGMRGECTPEEVEFMNDFILERRKKKFGHHQDGKLLTKEQIASYHRRPNLDSILDSLEQKGYLKKVGEGYKPVAGNFSFGVFKFLDPGKIAITLTSSDTEKLGVFHNGRVRRITPREAARLQGFPDSFKLHPDDRKAYYQLGNAVSVGVAQAVALEALKVSPLIERIRTQAFDDKKSAKNAISSFEKQTVQ